MSPPRGRKRRDVEVPLHRPKVALAHVVDEYAALGDRLTVDQLRRCLHPRIVVRGRLTVFPRGERAA